MSQKTISANLRRLRKVRGVTHEDLAEAAGITRFAYLNLETGISRPQPETLRSLARALEVGVQDLVTPAAELSLGDRIESVLATLAQDLDEESPEPPDVLLLRLVRKAVEVNAITLSRGAEILDLSLNEMRQLAMSWD